MQKIWILLNIWKGSDDVNSLINKYNDFLCAKHNVIQDFIDRKCVIRADNEELANRLLAILPSAGVDVARSTIPTGRLGAIIVLNEKWSDDSYVTYCNARPRHECSCGAEANRFYCHDMRIELLTPQSFDIFMSSRKGTV